MTLYENIMEDLYKIYNLVQESEEQDRDIEDTLLDIETYIQKYKELSIEGTQKYENELP